jgi:ankyrin repeat protein
MAQTKRRRIRARHFKQPTKKDLFLEAVATGNIEYIKKYIEDGENVKVRNCKGDTVLHIAAKTKQNKLLKYFLVYFSKEELDTRDMYGYPPHIVAEKYGNKIGAKLIEKYREEVTNSPYSYKEYSFRQPVPKLPPTMHKADRRSSSKNKQKNQNQNLYIVRKTPQSREQYVPVFNSKNMKEVQVQQKKARRKVVNATSQRNNTYKNNINNATRKRVVIRNVGKKQTRRNQPILIDRID